MKKGVAILSVTALAFLLFSGGAGAESLALKEWTFMVFLNGHNNLDSYGLQDLNEMEKIGSDNNLNIIVQRDTLRQGCKRYYVKRDTSSSIASEVIQDMGQVDMGDYREMVKFVRWAKEKYPAKKYMLVIWNHGSGWDKSKELIPLRGISYDDGTGNHITTPQLGIAMKEIQAILGQKLDVLGMDACLMQMMEVAYEVKDNVCYIVASEETEPGDGWAYDLMLAPISKNPTMPVPDFCRSLVQGFGQYYQNENGTTQSALDCSKLELFDSRLDKFVLALEKAIQKPEFMTIFKNRVRGQVQEFYISDNIDIVHFAKLAMDNISDGELREAAEELIAVATGGQNPLIILSVSTGYSVKNAFGLAIYCPTYGMNPDYEKLAFAKGEWARFIAGLQ